jgi:hypothetical protein
MNSEQQSWAALAVVILTAGIFLFRMLARKKNRSACGGSCGCGAPDAKKTIANPRSGGS